MSGQAAGAQALPPLRWFGAADVVASMPPLAERLRLAEITMTALATPGATQLPSKIGIHPRADGSFVHAMPAHLRAPEGDLVGMKWVAGFATNNALGIPAISAVVVLNDPATGVPVAILDGGPITAMRTAAVTGAALRTLGPSAPVAGAGPGTAWTGDVAVVGAGTQGRSHVEVVAGLYPLASLHLFDRHADRAEGLAGEARRLGQRAVEVHASARAATAAADVVITAASFTSPEARQVMTNDWLRPEATVVPVDYATFCSAEVARDAALFVVDQREQFLTNRDSGSFDDYPDPDATIGEVMLASRPRPAGRVVITHLGVGLADLVFADAIVRAATAAGRGTTLPR